eukprot:COSAG01_NODE_9026_length_2578_cov_6.119000_3_plen_122_part_00
MARFYMFSPRATLFAAGKHSIICECECECEYLGGEGTSNTSLGFPTHEAPHPLMRSYSSRQARDNVECDAASACCRCPMRLSHVYSRCPASCTRHPDAARGNVLVPRDRRAARPTTADESF